MLNAIEPYLNLTRWRKPIGSLLLLWPTLTALWLASHGVPTIALIVIFTLGVFVMRSAGCILNDIADRKFDAHVTRTKDRPIAAGELTVKQALVVFAGLLVLAFLLVSLLNVQTIKLAFIGVLLAVVYPFMKRYTYLPQVMLGVAFNWSVPMAYAAVLGYVPMQAWLFFFIIFLWIIVYDTLYAMVDRDDDLKIGVKSTAILFGRADRMILAMLQLLILGLLLVLGQVYQLRPTYYIGVVAAAINFIYQQYLIKAREPQACFKAFLNNHWALCCIFLGVVFSI